MQYLISSAHNQEEIVKQWIEDKGYHLGNIMNAFRLAIVGESWKGPHMFDITATIGKEETLSRLKTAISKIGIQSLSMYNFIIGLYAFIVLYHIAFSQKKPD